MGQSCSCCLCSSGAGRGQAGPAASGSGRAQKALAVGWRGAVQPRGDTRVRGRGISLQKQQKREGAGGI